nr:hypothetical protein [Tanacetum cinerariifolium]
MDNKKRIVNLEYFREMLHICPRLTGQTFDELPFKEEIMAFLRFLGHRAVPPKTKASVRKTKSSSDTTITPPTAAGTRLSTSAKGKQPAKSSKAKEAKDEESFDPIVQTPKNSDDVGNDDASLGLNVGSEEG